MIKIQKKLSNGSKIFPKINVALKQRMRHGAKLFCDDGTFHGFKQMYYSKYLSYKLMWLVILMGACGAAFYQIYDVIRIQFDRPTTTIIKPYSGRVRYPPLQICHAHWLYWVDWEKAMNVGLTHDSLTYGMSKWYVAYSDRSIDVADATNKFNNISLNFTSTVLDFYKYLARDEPAGFSSDHNYSYNRKFHSYRAKHMCYEPIADWNLVNTTEPLAIDLNYNGTFYVKNSFISDLEYVLYVTESLHVKMDVKDIKSEELDPISPMLYVDSVVDQITINSNFFEYVIHLKANVYKWINSDNSKCNPNEMGETDWLDLCKSKCSTKKQTEEKDACSDFDDITVLGNESYPLCPYPIHIYEEEKSSADIGYIHLTYEMLHENQSKKVSTSSSSTGVKAHFESVDCECVKPCEQWIYERTVIANQFPARFLTKAKKLPLTKIRITYPLPEKILLSVEQVSATWQSISGNIGGILGLWLGASAISFIQLGYLCCCKECDVGLVTRSIRRQKVLRPKTVSNELKTDQKY